eukprot:758882-Hanusia_phi.AAC.2
MRLGRHLRGEPSERVGRGIRMGWERKVEDLEQKWMEEWKPLAGQELARLAQRGLPILVSPRLAQQELR